MDVITSLAALQEAVNGLPAVPAGKVRVFRGQTDDYPKITPSSYRKPSALGALWSIYNRFLLIGMEPDEAARTSIRTSLSLGTGFSTSMMRTTSGGPYLVQTAAFICRDSIAVAVPRRHGTARKSKRPSRPRHFTVTVTCFVDRPN